MCGGNACKRGELKGKEMGSYTHHLKTERGMFGLVIIGLKTFDVRLNDRNFRINDFVIFEESEDGEYTGRVQGPVKIKFILDGGQYGIDKGYVVFCW